MTTDYRNTDNEGNARVTITHNDGSREVWRHAAPDLFALMHMVEHCDIKSFAVSLDV